MVDRKVVELRKRFHSDINLIARNLMDSYGVKFDPDNSSNHDYLIDWLDFVNRLVSTQPREVFFSSKFGGAFDKDTQSAIELIASKFSKGEDVNPYQSRDIKRFNYNKQKKKHLRTDLLWADWGIHHFHLTLEPLKAGSYFSGRADWLLFALVGYDYVCFIDIRSHRVSNVFSDNGLLNTIYQNWPELMARFELKGLKPPQLTLPNAEEVRAARRSGVALPYYVDGKVFMGLGLGLSTACTSNKVMGLASIVYQGVRMLVDIILNEKEQFSLDAKKAGINEPHWTIVYTPRGLAVFENNQDKAYLIPREVGVSGKNLFTEMHRIMLPEWIKNF